MNGQRKMKASDIAWWLKTLCIIIKDFFRKR